ncbi:MAG TPA: hypothetical protein PLZ42_02595 [Methanothrix sp.]|nr:hypothetical protein [Methanothrix sp.]
MRAEGGCGGGGGGGGEVEVEERGTALATTPITALELYRGAHLSADLDRNLAAAKKLLAALIVLPLDD